MCDSNSQTFRSQTPQMKKKISLIYFVVFTLLAVGLLPLLLTSWTLSERSAKELRAVEGRYQTQLVQDKARQIELFGQRYGDLVSGYAKALEFSDNLTVLSSPQTQEKLGAMLKVNPNLLAFYVKPINDESLSVFRSETIQKNEIELLAGKALGNLGAKKIAFSQPEKIKSSGESVLTVSAPVSIKENVAAAVVAVFSLKEIAHI